MTRHVFTGRAGSRSRVARGQPEMIAFCDANGLDSKVTASIVIDDEARTIDATIYHVDPAVCEGMRHLATACTEARELTEDADELAPCTRAVTVPLVEDLPVELALLADAPSDDNG